ncbi:MAG: molybdopterin molybdotransferase MoeA [Candidatus Aminicenantes bacterium]|nr:molybdopterin molybdotransferase MoeA [Candidatus Aminicenantes bacterium]
MILVEEAERILKQIPVRTHTEEAAVSDALGRILAKDVVSPIYMPPFDKSAMDGYAFISDDDSKRFKIIEIVPAGVIPKKKVTKGNCAKIMTGGMMPEGADRVIIKEVTEEKEGYMRIIGNDYNINLCRMGEDVKPGDVVLKKGTLIRPPEVGILASMGLSRFKAFRRPVVGIVVTGSELVDPGYPLKEGQIYDSNSYSLSAQVQQMGLKIHNAGIVADNINRIQRVFEELWQQCDVVIFSGGVSEGDYDFVPGILKNSGFELHFDKVAVKPGKPTVFATRKHDIVFGAPGNPVSTIVIFEIFIKPFLYRMMGHEFKPLYKQGILKNDLSRKRANRSAFVPVLYKDGEVKPLPYHGSAHIFALNRADGLVCITKGIKKMPAGSTVNVRSIQ